MNNRSVFIRPAEKRIMDLEPIQAKERMEIMSRTNEYKTDGGAYEDLSEALSSIDQLLEDVKRAHEEHEVVPGKQRGFRNVIAELQAELDGCITELRTSFAELAFDPLYIYTSEELSKTIYTRHIKFLHPEYQHVWLTDGNGGNVASDLLPFIDYCLTYDSESKKLAVSALSMKPKLNLPGLRTSLKAAHVDLEILKQDAQRVEIVNENGATAKNKLSEMLNSYCESHDIQFSIEEEIVPFWETEEERAARKEREAEEAKVAAEEAKRQAEEDRAVREAEAAAAASQRKAERERAAAQKKTEEERAARMKEEEAATAARAAADEEQKLKLQESLRSSVPPLPSAPPPAARSSIPSLPAPPPVKLRG